MSNTSHNRHNLEITEFKLVSSRKKAKKLQNYQVDKCLDDFDVNIDKSSVLRQIKIAEEEIYSSDLFSSTFASLREGLELLEKPEVKEIYCLGLGHIGERLIPRYQLALLICIKNKFDANVYVHDPILYDIEKSILVELGLNVLNENQEGKYEANSEFATIFYLPHCPKQLTNNLLWSNWTLNLKNCVIISNSFTNIIEATPKRSLSENGYYISTIFNYTVELPVINTFKYFEVFNDTAIHVFPIKKLLLIPEDFWNNRIEPLYTSNAVEFIANKFHNIQL